MQKQNNSNNNIILPPIYVSPIQALIYQLTMDYDNLTAYNTPNNKARALEIKALLDGIEHESLSKGSYAKMNRSNVAYYRRKRNQIMRVRINTPGNALSRKKTCKNSLCTLMGGQRRRKTRR